MRNLILALTCLAGAALAQPGPYGFPCNTTSGVPSLTLSRGEPKLGTSFDLSASWLNGGQPVTFVLGDSRTQWGALALPFNLAAIGRPDCNLYASVGILVTLPPGTWAGATWTIPVPNDVRLVGLWCYAQALNDHPAAGLAMTNGFALQIKA